MNRHGFVIRRLALTGPQQEPAQILLTSGLNILTGPSDTGKTFIVQCLNFMLGAKDPPKEIPEVMGYDTGMIEIEERATGRSITLSRSLMGGNITASETNLPPRQLKARHRAGANDTLSSLLLEMTGLDGKFVATNKHGNTRSMSFRDLAPFIIVNEEDIIKEASPVLTGQHTSKTVEARVFNLLLTGIDDSAIESTQHDRQAKERQSIKSILLAEIADRSRKRIERSDVPPDIPSIQQEIKAVENRLEKAVNELSNHRESIGELESTRTEHLQALRRCESRIAVLKELRQRFVLLREQYDSDVFRLEAVAEAGTRLAQLTEERCPVCGALAQHHDGNHADADISPDLVAKASLAEATGIRKLVSDLEDTIRTNEAEIHALENDASEAKRRLAHASKQISDQLQPRLHNALAIMGQQSERRAMLETALALRHAMADLEALGTSTTNGTDDPPVKLGLGVKSAPADKFSREIESVLDAWNFPDARRVSFDHRKNDLVISGWPRTSRGKGVRAITYAAFSIGLMRYCQNRDLPHPGLVILDSPLVTYREPDPGDEELISHGVKEAFFRELAFHDKRCQVIVLENERPPDDITNEANIIRFTKAEHGRYGFIPLSPG